MKQEVWLINLFGCPTAPSSFNPDNSLAALAGSLKQSGYAPKIFDYQTVSFCSSLIPNELGLKIEEILNYSKNRNLSKDDLEKIAALNQEIMDAQLQIIDKETDKLIKLAAINKPLFIGVKLYSGEGAQLTERMVSRLREYTTIPIVAGGALIRVMGKKLLKYYTVCDYFLNGEADRSIVDFAKFIEGNKSISQVPGLIYKDKISSKIIENPHDNIMDLNELAEPCYDEDVYPALYQKDEKAMVFQIDESRGCPNACSFCVHPHISGRGTRVYSVERIVRQIKNLQEKFGAYAFRFTGSNTPKKFLKEFAAKVKEENLDIKYSCFGSINTTDISIIEPLAQSGLVGYFIGVETVDQDILLNSFNKRGQPIEKVYSIIRSLLDNGIFATTSWMYPAPNMQPDLRDRLRDFILKAYANTTPDDGSVIVIPSCLVPSSTWFFDYKKYGFDVPDEDAFFQGYIRMMFKPYVPRQLMGNFGFTLDGKNFDQLASETDNLQRDLAPANTTLGLADDWMLMGKLSGFSMKEFKKATEQNFIHGDYTEIKKIISEINKNSTLKNWAESENNKKLHKAA